MKNNTENYAWRRQAKLERTLERILKRIQKKSIQKYRLQVWSTGWSWFVDVDAGSDYNNVDYE